MPNYSYKAREPDPACETCHDGFQVMQPLSEDPLESCPECERVIRRVILRGSAASCMTNRRWNTKKMLSDGNLKRMGFKKYVKEGDGKYRDILAD